MLALLLEQPGAMQLQVRCYDARHRPVHPQGLQHMHVPEQRTSQLHQQTLQLPLQRQQLPNRTNLQPTRRLHQMQVIIVFCFDLGLTLLTLGSSLTFLSPVNKQNGFPSMPLFEVYQNIVKCFLC